MLTFKNNTNFNKTNFNFIKKDSGTGVFPKCCEISKNTFFYRAPPVAASVTYDNIALTLRKKR